MILPSNRVSVLFLLSQLPAVLCALKGTPRKLQTITSLLLVNADSNSVIATLTEGATIDIAGVPQLNILANARGPTKSVRFSFEGNANFRTESVVPYAFCGDLGGDYNSCSELTVGTHTVTATPFSAGGANGTPGSSTSVTFTLVISNDVPVPATPGPTAPVVTFTSGPTASPTTLSPVVAQTAAPMVATATPSFSQTLAPVATLTATPVATSTLVPVVTATAAPTLPATPAPTALVVTPTSGPTASPTSDNPVVAQTAAPMVTAAPSSSLTLAPVGSQTATPVATRTATPVATSTLAPVVTSTATPTLPPVACKIPKFVGNWLQTTKYPIPAAEAQGSIIGDDFIVISGFTMGYGQSTDKNYALSLSDPNAAWRPMDDLPVSQGITHAAFAVVGMKLYMCGGYLGGHPGPHIATCLVYDHTVTPGSGNQWTTFPSLPEGRAGGGMVYDETRNALVFAGGAERPKKNNPDAVDYQHTWMYEFESPGWKEMPDIPFLSNHMSYVTTKDAAGKARHFFVGGQVGENEFTGNVDSNYEWDAIGENWIKRQDMPFTRGHASSSTNAVPCGYIIAGGSTNEFGKTKDISYFDIASNTWTKIGDLPNALNTPVCAIDFERGMYYCETGWYVPPWS